MQNYYADEQVFPTTAENQIRVEILNMVIRELSPQQHQMYRPYTTQTTSEVIDFVNKRDPSLPFTAQALAPIANQFLAPSAIPQDQVRIANNWDTKRFAFNMRVKVTTALTETVEVVAGYTNYLGIDEYSKSKDGRMRLTINSITILTVINNSLRVASSNNLMNNAHSYDSSSTNALAPNSIYHISPGSVLNELAYRELQNDSFTYMGRQITSAKMAPMSQSTQTGFLADLIIPMQRGVFSPDMKVGGDTRYGFLASAANAVTAPQLYDSQFMRALTRAFNQITPEFTLDELRSFDPLVDSKMHIYYIPANQREDYSRTTEHHQGADPTTLFAINVNNGIAPILMDNLITAIEIHATNMNLGGQSTIMLAKPRTYVEYDLSRYLDNVRHRLQTEILNGLTMNNQIPYELIAKVDVMGDTLVQVKFGDQTYFTPFTFPTFASSLTSPLLTPNHMTVDNNVQNIGTLFDSLIDTHGYRNSGLPVTNPMAIYNEGSLQGTGGSTMHHMPGSTTHAHTAAPVGTNPYSTNPYATDHQTPVANPYAPNVGQPFNPYTS